MDAREIKSNHERLLRNLKILQTFYSREELARAIGVSKNTWNNRMKEPWRLFGIDDFRCIASYCRIDFVKLVDGEINIG